MSHLALVKNSLSRLANREKAAILSRFFKTGQGQYGYGDKFLGITVPCLRQQAKRFEDLAIKDTLRLLHSLVHEERLLALLILQRHFDRAAERDREHIVQIYLNNTRYINNWDLVDLSAGKIVGEYLKGRDISLLSRLARSGSLWERRIAIVATFPFIRQGEFSGTLRIARTLLNDKEDLIHKAVGWMLREVGKQDRKVLETFLQKYYQNMPRTMLRYAIERLPETRRQDYLRGRI